MTKQEAIKFLWWLHDNYNLEFPMTDSVANDIVDEFFRNIKFTPPVEVTPQPERVPTLGKCDHEYQKILISTGRTIIRKCKKCGHREIEQVPLTKKQQL